MEKQSNNGIRKHRIVVIGGGTGSFAALSGLKKYPVELTAIVTMMDNGGSSGRLRDELGVLPPGDVRQCLVALSNSSKLLRELFNYRFAEGDLKGHNFGNIFLSALEKTTGSMADAIAEVGRILRINGKVVPVTYQKTDLCVELENEETIVGETHIDVVEEQIERPPIKRAFLKPDANANPEAVKAIEEADYILIGPGDLYTSIIPNLLVKGIAEAIKTSKAKKIFVMNLMTKFGQTTNYTALEHIKHLKQYIGKDSIDVVLINNELIDTVALAWYQEYGEHPVIDDVDSKSKYHIIRENLLKDVVLEKNTADSLKRSLIRHDPEKLASVVMALTLPKEN